MNKKISYIKKILIVIPFFLFISCSGKNKDLVPPGEVRNLKFMADNSTIKLYWESPADEDFEKVFISYNKKTKKVTKDVKSFDILNLENGNKYTFILQTADKAGNKSAGVKLEVPLYVFTELPLKVSENSVIFGDWPQSLKEDEVTVSSEQVVVNGLSCYFGSDGYYYVKMAAKPYISVVNNQFDNVTNTDYTFENGTVINKDNEYYFKVEPILWNILTDDFVDYEGNHTGALLLSDKILFAQKYDSYSNKYENSEIRNFLEGININSQFYDFQSNGFLKSAFTPEAVNKISSTVIDNSFQSLFGSKEHMAKEKFIDYSPVKDKVFLLSEKEVTEKKYGFDIFDAEDKKRVKAGTDFAKANGIEISEDGSSWWWLRSPYYTDDRFVRFVYDDGYAYSYSMVNYKRGGIVPAISLKL